MGQFFKESTVCIRSSNLPHSPWKEQLLEIRISLIWTEAHLGGIVFVPKDYLIPKKLLHFKFFIMEGFKTYYKHK